MSGGKEHCLSTHIFNLKSNADRELTEAWRAVANAKLKEYRRQSWRLALLVQRGVIDKQQAVHRLWEIATAHAVVRSLGEDHVQAIIAEPFTAVCAVAA
jgi:hypothetical protein